MHWIEQVLGLSPDGGSGSTEVIFGLAAVAITLAFLFHHSVARALRF